MLVVIWMTLLFSVMADPWGINFSEDPLTSEAGLCIVIPCSFTHAATFNPTSAKWFHNCDPTIPNSICQPIFDSKNTNEAEVSFRGRVALSEPDITQKNCSITIKDLTVSDTGSYHFRVGGTTSTKADGYNFQPGKTLTVTGLTQKPKVNVPAAVIEGQETTLTCTAPGLCSGTPPNIAWSWRKTGHDGSLFPSSFTNFETISQRHSSKLTFTPSSEHYGSQVTCQVNFKGDIKTEETVTLNVICQTQTPQVNVPAAVKEGQLTTLTCTAPRHCSGNPPKITWTWRKTGHNGSVIPSSVTVFKTENVGQRHSSKLTFTPSSEHYGSDVTCQVTFKGDNTTEATVTLNVICQTQTPQVNVPAAVKEGQLTTLTCTAPRHCSGNPPNITWTWRKTGHDGSLIPSSVTVFKTENVGQRHSSKLTFTPSSEHYGSDVTCQVTFKGDNTTEATVTLNVICLTRKPKVNVPPAVIEGQQTTLTCTAPKHCSGTPPNITWTWRKTGHDGSLSLISSNVTNFETVSQRHSSNLTFTPSSEHYGTQVTCQVTFKGNITTVKTVTLNVTCQTQTPQVNIPPAVKEGQQTTLTCTAPRHCSGNPPKITWTWRKTGHNGSVIPSSVTVFKTENVGQRHSSKLTFTPSSEHYGSEVTCQVTFKGDNTTEATVTLNVTCLRPKPKVNVPAAVIEGQQTTLTCTAPKHCSGTPPNITWTWRKTGHDGSLIPRSVTVFETISQRHSSNLTFTPTSEHYGSQVTCQVTFKGNIKTEETVSLNVTCEPIQGGQDEGFFSTEKKTIIAFLIGVTLSMTICCMAKACHRCKEKKPRDQAEMLQMVTCQDQQTGGQRGDGDEQTPRRENKEVEYAKIDYTLLKKRSAEAERKQETTETEYAEVKREGGSKTQDSGAVDNGTLKSEDEEVEAMIGQHHQNTGHCTTEEEEDEYANIDYSQLKKRSAEAERKQETTEAEYAEVKRKGGNKTQDSDAEDSGTLKREDEEEEAMIGQHEETTEEEEGEPLYASVKAIMGQRETLEGGGEADRDQNSGTPDSSFPQREEKEVEYDNNDYSQVKKRSAKVKREGGNETQDSGAVDSGTLKSDDEEEEAMTGQLKTGHCTTEEEEDEYADIDYSQLKKRSAEAEGKQETTEPEYVEFKGEGGDKTQDSGAEDSGTLKGEDEEEEAMIGQYEETEHLMTEEEEGEPLYANVKAIMGEGGMITP